MLLKSNQNKSNQITVSLTVRILDSNHLKKVLLLSSTEYTDKAQCFKVPSFRCDILANVVIAHRLNCDVYMYVKQRGISSSAVYAIAVGYVSEDCSL